MTDWEFVSNDTQEFESSFQHDIQQHQPKEITKRHWVKKEDRPYCKSCKKKFTLIERTHHCRRCGEGLCSECLVYNRRLNFLAHPDPQGKLYKVCKECFDEGHDTDVPTRRLTELFKAFKYQGRRNQETNQNAKSCLVKTYRDKLDLAEECERLRKGFLKSVSKSDVRRALKEMSNIVKTPDWQKSANWMQESMADKCQFCTVMLGLLTKKYSCKLCGRVICKKCSTRDLLLYLPDEDLNNGVHTSTQAQLAVIRVVGSPEVEPELSMLLHVCQLCRQYVVDLQVNKVEKQLESEVKDMGQEEVIARLIALDGNLAKLHEKINTQLTMYQEVVESLEDSSRSSRANNNTKVLAKAQDDLSDYFSSWCIKIPVIKKMVPEADTTTRRKLLNYYLKARSDFYLDNVYTFRMLKRKLSESAPPEMLEYIQKIVDKHAIVSAQIYIRQLTFESINLCVKHSLQDQSIPQLLSQLDEVIEEEASQCLLTQGEDLDKHGQYLKQIVHSQIKDHRLVRVSKRQLASAGSRHVAELLVNRLQEILYQVMVQLEMKSINRSFQKSKASLEQSKTQAEVLTVQDILNKS